MFTPVSLKGKLFQRYLRTFSHPAKIRIQNMWGKYFFSGGMTLKNEDQLRFVLDANDWITRIFLLQGNYESGSTQLAKKIMEPGGIFVDVGANFGLFTCQVAHGNKAIKVFSIEPNYKITGRLLHNIQMNELQEQVKVLNMAVSRKIQFVSLKQPAADNIGTTQTVAGSGGELSVLSSSLDFILQQNGLTKIDLLKIDIEGNEFDILEDFPFEEYPVKNIILEFNHLSSVSFETLQLFFKGKGFKSFTITGKPLLTEMEGLPENNIWLVNQHNH